MGHYGQSRTPGQGQDFGRHLDAKSLLSAMSSARMPFGPFSPVGLFSNFPIFLKLPKLPPSRMGHYGQAQTPGQGQDIGRHPTKLHNKGDLVMKSPCYVCDREWIMS